MLEPNVQSMQISLPLSVSLSVSVSQKFGFLFYLANKVLYRPLLRPRRASMRHPCLPLTLSLVPSLPRPTQGESSPPCPAPLPRAGNAPTASARPHHRSPQESRFCLLHPRSTHHLCSTPPLLPTSPLLPPSPPPKALGFSFMKCGLNIIFGKLTALSLQLPPTSEKKEHLEASVANPQPGAATL